MPLHDTELQNAPDEQGSWADNCLCCALRLKALYTASAAHLTLCLDPVLGFSIIHKHLTDNSVASNICNITQPQTKPCEASEELLDYEVLSIEA